MPYLLRPLKQKLSALLEKSIIPTLFWLLFFPLPVLASEHAIVLQYHHIGDKTNNTSITTQQFREHLKYLKKNKFSILPLEEITNALKNKTPLPEKSVAITFDDAFRSTFENAFPILKEYDWPFAVFINTQSVDRNLKKFLTWEHLREMGQYGATLVNHTINHSYMIRREKNTTIAAWKENAEIEISLAEERIRLETGQSHHILAYPYGEYSPELISIVKKLKFTAFGQHSGPVGFHSDLATLPRFPASGVYSKLSSLATKLHSIPLPVLKNTLIDEKGSTLQSHIINSSTERPAIQLTIGDTTTSLNRLTCFASGEGEITVDLLDVKQRIIKAHTSKAISFGRSRINCTLPTKQKGIYYWHSQPLIKLQDHTTWIVN